MKRNLLSSIFISVFFCAISQPLEASRRCLLLVRTSARGQAVHTEYYRRLGLSIDSDSPLAVLTQNVLGAQEAISKIPLEQRPEFFKTLLAKHKDFFSPDELTVLETFVVPNSSNRFHRIEYEPRSLRAMQTARKKIIAAGSDPELAFFLIGPNNRLSARELDVLNKRILQNWSFSDIGATIQNQSSGADKGDTVGPSRTQQMYAKAIIKLQRILTPGTYYRSPDDWH
jgi:hypothetical protein